MTSPARVAGCYGSRKPDPDRPVVAFSRIATGVIPSLPPYVDYLAELGGGWNLLGNGPDPAVGPGFPGCGDCVSVTLANFTRLVTGLLTSSPHYPGWSDVLRIYRTQNPDFDPFGDPYVNGPGSQADGGMQIAQLLDDLVANPGWWPYCRLVGWAQVDHSNPAEVKAAIATGALWVGTLVQADNEQQFANGEPWSWNPGSPEVGGHSMLFGAYGNVPADAGNTMLRGDEKGITWAEEESFTDSFWAHQVNQCYLPVWEPQLGSREFQQAVDVAAFAREWEAITGKRFPVPVPTPAPPPADPDAALWQAAGPWCAEGRTRPDLVELKAALETWAHAKGF